MFGKFVFIGLVRKHTLDLRHMIGQVYAAVRELVPYLQGQKAWHWSQGLNVLFEFLQYLA